MLASIARVRALLPARAMSSVSLFDKIVKVSQDTGLA